MLINPPFYAEPVIISVQLYFESRGSAAGIATRYRKDGPRIEFRYLVIYCAYRHGGYRVNHCQEAIQGHQNERVHTGVRRDHD